MKFACPHCTQRLEADDDMAGVEVACPSCSRYVRLPDTTTNRSIPAPPMMSMMSAASQSGLVDQTLLETGAVDGPLRPGTAGSVDRFEIIKPLGSGGMGQVFLAREPTTGTKVALKLMRPDLVRQSRLRHGFLIEARHMYNLSHPNVLRVLEVKDRDEGPYYVMPYMAGGSLADVLAKDEPIPADRALSIIRQVSDALAYAHSKGLIHRDLKPGNVLLDEDGRAYLTDFGLVRTVYNDSMIDVTDTQCQGTPAYMSPSVAAGNAEDTRCDIYGIGAMLYEMLAGQPPYRGPTPDSIVRQVIAGPPKPILQINPKAHKGLVRIVESAMARELRDRYAEMSDIVKELDRVTAGKLPLGPHGRARQAFEAMPLRQVAYAGAALASIAMIAFLLRGTIAVPRFGIHSGHGSTNPTSALLSSSWKDSLVLHYTFPQTNTGAVADWSGNSHTGTVNGTVRFRATEKNTGYWFEGGVNDFLAVHMPNDFGGFPLNDFTIGIRFTALNEGALIGSGQHGSAPENRFYWYISSQEFAWCPGADQNARSLRYSLQNNTEHRFFLSRHGETVTAFVDAKKVASTTNFITASLPVYDFGLRIGSCYDQNTPHGGNGAPEVHKKPFNGILSEFVILNRVLTLEEIKGVITNRMGDAAQHGSNSGSERIHLNEVRKVDTAKLDTQAVSTVTPVATPNTSPEVVTTRTSPVTPTNVLKRWETSKATVQGGIDAVAIQNKRWVVVKTEEIRIKANNEGGYPLHASQGQRLLVSYVEGAWAAQGGAQLLNPDKDGGPWHIRSRMADGTTRELIAGARNTATNPAVVNLTEPFDELIIRYADFPGRYFNNSGSATYRIQYLSLHNGDDEGVAADNAIGITNWTGYISSADPKAPKQAFTFAECHDPVDGRLYFKRVKWDRDYGWCNFEVDLSSLNLTNSYYKLSVYCRNAQAEGGIERYDTSVSLWDQTGSGVQVNLCGGDDGWAQQHSYLGVGDEMFENRMELVRDFQAKRDLSLVYSNRTATVVYEGSTILTHDFGYTMRGIKSVKVRLKGAGSLFSAKLVTTGDRVVFDHRF